MTSDHHDMCITLVICQPAACVPIQLSLFNIAIHVKRRRDDRTEVQPDGEGGR